MSFPRLLARSAVTVGAITALAAPGLPMASAAPYPVTGTNVTGITVSPTSDGANTGICNPYTASLSATGPGSVTVLVTENVPNPAAATTIGFCNPLGGNDGTTTGAAVSPADTAGSAASGSTCTSGGGAAAGATVACEAPFIDTGDKTIVFGVTSNQAGAMAIRIFTDRDGSGTESGSETGRSATKTWSTASPTSNSNTISCSPPAATNEIDTVHAWTCTVVDNDTSPQPVPGAAVRFLVLSGPDAGVGDSCGTSGTGESGNKAEGTVNCSYKNLGSPGHDVIRVWVETGGNTTWTSPEPTTQIAKDWTALAPSGAALKLTCSPNQTTTTGNDPTCDEPTTQKTVTITATVTNGALPVSNVAVSFDQPSDVSPLGTSDNGDTETVAPTQCTTSTSGQCSVTFTDSSPVTGEKFTVRGRVAREGTSDATATATISYHTPTPTKADARNIAVTPDGASSTAPGTRNFTAKVTDRNSQPVSGVLVKWTESGPGTFADGTSAATCTTGSGGTCVVTTKSVSTDRGLQTVTGTIDSSNYPTPGVTSNNNECQAPSGKTYTAPNSSTNQGTASGAPAGNCSDNGSVTWTAPPPVVRETPTLDCWSPRAHVLKCRVVSHPRLVGADVTFRKVLADGTYGRILATDTTNDNGVASFVKRNLKSGKLWRVIAKVHRQGEIRGGFSNVDRARIT